MYECWRKHKANACKKGLNTRKISSKGWNQSVDGGSCGKSKDEIKACMEVSDEDIDSVTTEEVEAEKTYYREKGYLQ